MLKVDATDLQPAEFGDSGKLAVGDRVVAIADDATKTMTIERNGVVENSMPISMGSGTWPTPNGTYMIGDQHQNMVMDSTTYGLALEDGEEAQAALITPDRKLGRRVAAELARFGIEADDSAGTPLLSTPQGTLLRLLAEAALRPGDPVQRLRIRLRRHRAEIAVFGSKAPEILGNRLHHPERLIEPFQRTGERPVGHGEDLAGSGTHGHLPTCDSRAFCGRGA